MPSRRTFAKGIVPFAHCGESGAPQSLLRLLSQPARGHGQPLPWRRRTKTDSAATLSTGRRDRGQIRLRATRCCERRSRTCMPFRKRMPGGGAHAPRDGVADQRRQDAGAQSASSEWSPGWAQRTSVSRGVGTPDLRKTSMSTCLAERRCAGHFSGAAGFQARPDREMLSSQSANRGYVFSRSNSDSASRREPRRMSSSRR